MQMLNLVLELEIWNLHVFLVILEYDKGKICLRCFFFSPFLNDLTEFISHAYDGLNDISDMSHIFLSNDDIEVYFKLYILLYADDTFTFA